MKYIKEYVNFEDWDEEEGDNMPDEFIGHENFYNFLVNNDILDKWIYNVKTYGRWNIKQILNSPIRSFIDISSPWKNTPEGHDFWSKMQFLWHKDIKFI